MIRFILFCIKIATVLLVALSLNSCRWNFETGENGNGKTKSEIRNLDNNFSKIVANNAVEVIVEQANTTQIEVETDENLLSRIKTTVENNTLTISCEGVRNASNLLVRVKMPHVEYLESNNASEIKCQNTLTGKDLKIKCSNAGEIAVIAEYDAIDIEASGSGTVNISGKTLTLNTNTSGAAEVEAFDLYANAVTAQATSASSIEVNPRVSLDAQASSAASIEYKGIAKSIKKSESSGGEISKVD